jgi:hypothetical protein
MLYDERYSPLERTVSKGFPVRNPTQKLFSGQNPDPDLGSDPDSDLGMLQALLYIFMHMIDTPIFGNYKCIYL